MRRISIGNMKLSTCIMRNAYKHQKLINKEKYGKHLFHENSSRPIMLFCETVNICNNNCIICPYGLMTRKKETMSLELFEKVLVDYSLMGGGALSLTSVVGDIFLDKYLVNRFELLKKYEDIIDVSFSTNAIASDVLTDNELSLILKRLKRIYISVYGLDTEESLAITRKDNYTRALKNINRIISLTDNPQKIRLGLRCVKSHDEVMVRAWIKESFGVEVAYDYIESYANWGGAMDIKKPLPFKGKWIPIRENFDQCLVPLIAAQVFSNGDISFCPCCDYNSVRELHLGNVRKKTISDIYNEDKTAKLWNFEKGQVPQICRYCSFHKPLKDIENTEFIFNDPYQFIGG